MRRLFAKMVETVAQDWLVQTHRLTSSGPSGRPSWMGEGCPLMERTVPRAVESGVGTLRDCALWSLRRGLWPEFPLVSPCGDEYSARPSSESSWKALILIILWPTEAAAGSRNSFLSTNRRWPFVLVTFAVNSRENCFGVSLILDPRISYRLCINRSQWGFGIRASRLSLLLRFLTPLF